MNLFKNVSIFKSRNLKTTKTSFDILQRSQSSNIIKLGRLDKYGDPFSDQQSLQLISSRILIANYVRSCFSTLNRHSSSVDLSATTILQSWVQIPSTPSILLPFTVNVAQHLQLCWEKDEDKQKRHRVWTIYKMKLVHVHVTKRRLLLLIYGIV